MKKYEVIVSDSAKKDLRDIYIPISLIIFSIQMMLSIL